jgi:hypothetical protein
MDAIPSPPLAMSVERQWEITEPAGGRRYW